VNVAGATKTYGQDDSASLTGTITGIRNGDTITTTYNSTGAAATADVGSYAITAALADGGTGKLADYAVTVNPGTLTVTPAPLTVTVANATKTYGQDDSASLTATVTGAQNGDALTAAYSSTGSAATADVKTGGYPITAALSGAKFGDYAATVNTGTLTVTPVALTVTANNQTKVYGAALPTLTAWYSGFVNGDTASRLTTPPALTTNATPTSAVGAYTITPSGAASPDYTISYVAGILTVTQAATQTALTASANAINTDQSLTLMATVSALSALAPGSSLPTGSVTFLYGTSRVSAPVAGNGVATLVLPAGALIAGTYKFTATYSGDTNFQASTSSAATVVVQPDTGPLPPPAVSVPLYQPSPNERYLTRVYQDLFGVARTPATVTALGQLLDQGVSRFRVVLDLLRSPDYSLLRVQSLYRTLLHRRAGRREMEQALRFLAHGGTLAQLETLLLASRDYFQHRGGGTGAGFLEALSEDLLGQPANAAVVAEFGGLVADDGDRLQTITSVLQLAAVDQRRVQDLFQHFLHRAPSARELHFYTDVLQRGGSEERILAALLSSPRSFPGV
jgi:hypothetical protein